MVRIKIKKDRGTAKKFTVVFCCVDPPIPVIVFNTNNRASAEKEYDGLKKLYKDDPGGESTLTFYEHTNASRRTVMHDPEGFVYCIMYEGSIIVESYGYMDLLQEELDRADF